MHVVNGANETVTIEEEIFVPFVPPTDPDDQQFGWRNAIAHNTPWARNALWIHVLYDTRPEEEHVEQITQTDRRAAAWRNLPRWLTHVGGNVSAVALSARREGSPPRVTVRAATRPGTILAFVPHTASVGVSSMLRNEAIAELARSSQWRALDHRFAQMDLFRTRVSAELALMTLFLMLFPSDPTDGTRHHIFAETLFDSTIAARRAHAHDELNRADFERAMLPMSPWLVEHVRLEKDMWLAELAVAKEVWPWASESLRDTAMFLRARCAVAAAVMERRGPSQRGGPVVRLLVPFLHAVRTSDVDNAVVRVSTDGIALVARVAMAAGDEITISFAASEDTKIERFLHLGCVPLSAVDAAEVDGVELRADRKASREPLIARMREATVKPKPDSGKQSSDAAAPVTRVALLMRLRVRLEARMAELAAFEPPADVSPLMLRAVHRLRTSFLSTLAKHLAWLSDDLPPEDAPSGDL